MIIYCTTGIQFWYHFEVWYITLLLPYLSLCIFLAIDESTICMILKYTKQRALVAKELDCQAL